nr:tRNA (adenosine(37)-N6)-threonylcarbamoyltransferase complex dimerization subunit type 1 TsaB [uncultured Desulfobulbus sp.]
MADVLILAIETSTGCGSVSITRGDSHSGKVLGEYTLQPEVTHSRRLLGSVSGLMEGLSLSWNDLHGIAVSQGPGSFTGLRIGMAAAKGIAMAADLPLIGVPTLDGLSLLLTPAAQPVYLVLDARKQQVYAACYRLQEEGWQRSSNFEVLTPDELAASITEPCLVAGPGVAACAAQLAGHSQVQLLSSALLHPRAAGVGFMGASLLAERGFVGEENPVPLYVRASEAELNLKRK